MFELYQFNPETIKTEGFKLISKHETEQECHDKALLDGVLFYLIEKRESTFSRKMFMSDLPKPPEPEVIPEPQPEPEVISEPETIPEPTEE